MGMFDDLIAKDSAPAGPAGGMFSDLVPEPVERSMVDRAGRQVGLTVRAGIQNASALPTMIADIPARVYNLGATGVDAMAGTNLPRAPLFIDAQNRALDRYLPKPGSGVEEFANAVAGSMAGAGSSVKLGELLAKAPKEAVSYIGRMLSTGPGSQVVSAATGAGAGDIARQSGAGVPGQILASVMGAAAPTAAQAAGSGTIRSLMRGGEDGRQTLIRNMDDFKESGVQPTVGQATQRRTPQGMESFAAKVPGGAGVMERNAERATEQAAQRVEQIADNLSPKGNATTAGLTIERGISGDNGFVSRFKGEQKFLYDKVDKYVPSQSAVDVARTREALSALNSDIPNAPALSQWFKNAKIKDIERALVSDSTPEDFNPIMLGSGGGRGAPPPPPTLPYEALKKLRTLIGSELENTSLVSDIPRSKWKALYKAVSEDLGGAAKQAGPKAEQAFNRANTYSRAGYDRIESFLDRVAGKDSAEKIFQSVVNPSELREGASTVNAVMKSLAPPERDVVKSAFIRRMGQATAANQGAEGGEFSFNTFLTNWNKVSPEAKRTLFAGQEGQLRADLDSLARVAEMVKDSNKVFANPSGTARATASAGIGGAVVGSVMSGSPTPVAIAGGTMALANFVARKANDPQFVKWIAKQTQMNESAVASQLTALAQQAGRSQEVGQSGPNQ